MDCPQCGTPNSDGFKFCMKCGANLPQVLACQQCGTVNPHGFQFCLQCGHALGHVVASTQKIAAPAAPPPAAPPQPQVVIIKEGNERRTPTFLLILMGMLLAVMMCAGLLWLNIIEPPYDLVASLPDPLPEIVDAISHQQIPDMGGQERAEPDGDDGVAQAPPAEADPPSNNPASGDATIILHNNSIQTIWDVYISACSEMNWGDDALGNTYALDEGETHTFSMPAGCYDLRAMDYDDVPIAIELAVDVNGTYHWYVGPRPDVCEEALQTIIRPFSSHDLGHTFSSDIIHSVFHFDGRLRLSNYDLYVEQYGVSSGPYEGYTEWPDHDDHSTITIPGPFQYLAGPAIFRFAPRGLQCILAEQSTVMACQSGEEYHPDFPYNSGCCTNGCWCQQAGEWGCWTSCASYCAE